MMRKSLKLIFGLLLLVLVGTAIGLLLASPLIVGYLLLSPLMAVLAAIVLNLVFAAGYVLSIKRPEPERRFKSQAGYIFLSAFYQQMFFPLLFVALANYTGLSNSILAGALALALLLSFWLFKFQRQSFPLTVNSLAYIFATPQERAEMAPGKRIKMILKSPI